MLSPGGDTHRHIHQPTVNGVIVLLTVFYYIIYDDSEVIGSPLISSEVPCCDVLRGIDSITGFFRDAGSTGQWTFPMIHRLNNEFSWW